jgi:hypothetical protein
MSLLFESISRQKIFEPARGKDARPLSSHNFVGIPSNQTNTFIRIPSDETNNFIRISSNEETSSPHQLANVAGSGQSTDAPACQIGANFKFIFRISCKNVVALQAGNFQ